MLVEFIPDDVTRKAFEQEFRTKAAALKHARLLAYEWECSFKVYFPRQGKPVIVEGWTEEEKGR